MSASKWMTAIIGGRGSILLTTHRSETYLENMGTSCPASIAPMKPCLTSFSIVPPMDKTSLVAVRVWHHSGKKLLPYEQYYFLLTAGYNGAGEAKIDLNRQFVPDANRLIQLSDEGLSMTTQGQTFVTPDFNSKPQAKIEEMKANWAKRNVRIVPDANLLCRFAVGQATLEEVIAAAEALKEEEAWPAKYAELEQRCARAALQEAEDWAAKYAQRGQLLVEANSQITQLNSELRDLKIGANPDTNGITFLRQTIKLIVAQAGSSRFGNRAKVLQWIASFGKDAVTSGRKTPLINKD